MTALALNSSYDHAGGWFSFAERACHREAAPCLASPTADQSAIGDYPNDQTLWSLPWEGYRMQDYRMCPAEATQLVDEGDVFDPGDRTLEVFNLPEREEGGLAVWEPATGSLFPSDMLYDGEHGLAWPPEHPDAYCASLRRTRELPVNCVYAGHYGRFGRARMIEIIDAQLSDLEDRA